MLGVLLDVSFGDMTTTPALGCLFSMQANGSMTSREREATSARGCSSSETWSHLISSFHLPLLESSESINLDYARTAEIEAKKKDAGEQQSSLLPAIITHQPSTHHHLSCSAFLTSVIAKSITSVTAECQDPISPILCWRPSSSQGRRR